MIDEAERLYSTTVENITNEVITNFDDKKSSVSLSLQKERSEQMEMMCKCHLLLCISKKNILFSIQKIKPWKELRSKNFLILKLVRKTRMRADL